MNVSPQEERLERRGVARSASVDLPWLPLLLHHLHHHHRLRQPDAQNARGKVGHSGLRHRGHALDVVLPVQRGQRYGQKLSLPLLARVLLRLHNWIAESALSGFETRQEREILGRRTATEEDDVGKIDDQHEHTEPGQIPHQEQVLSPFSRSPLNAAPSGVLASMADGDGRQRHVAGATRGHRARTQSQSKWRQLA